MNRWEVFRKTAGPGLLFAAAAIGVSHLVQSTRAGAEYGFELVWAIILANLFKWPFFEFGSRYAAATGESLIQGYMRIGKWALWIYILITLGSMFAVTAAVSFVCAGLFGNLLGTELSVDLLAAIIFAICMVILLFGKYKLLDSTIKIVGFVLLISTLVATTIALSSSGAEVPESFTPKDAYSASGILFIIALMGWMPSAIDLAAWNSIWTIERQKLSGYRASVRQTILEFNIGYSLSAGLSICFLILGSVTMYGSGEEFSDSGVAFAGQIVSIFTETLGEWSYWIISISAFSVMFSTVLTVFDGYSRSISHSFEMLVPKLKQFQWDEVFWIVVIGVGSYFVIAEYKSKLTSMVDFATTLSFVIAPVFAGLNYYLLKSKHTPKQHRPRGFINLISILGLIFLSGFVVVFFVISK
jgi:Mn2+/Fe2+ NRAMP family transporter